MKRAHKTEKRDRTITESFCNEPRCKFRGERIQQGVCYSVPDLDAKFEARFLKQQKEAYAELAFMKKHAESPKDYLKTLEAYYTATLMNWTSTLDELVHLRGQVALLRRKKKYET